MKKALLAITFILLIKLVNGQSVTDTNLLSLKDSTDFYEINYFYNDSNVLYQEIKYDEKGILHEEYWYFIIIRFKQNFLEIEDSIYHIGTDSCKVKYEFCTFEYWDIYNGINDTNYQTTGTIEIIEITKKKIIIRQNIQVLHLDTQKKYLIIGESTFNRKRR